MAEQNALKYKNGHLDLLDDIEHMSPELGTALHAYSDGLNQNRNSRQWIQAIQWIENILFGLGRQYVAELNVSSLNRAGTSDNSQSLRNAYKKIPTPTNDFIGKYVETNIALLTENRPQPRVSPKGDSREDRKKAEISQLVIEYLWEVLDMPEKHREIARLLMYCGVAFMELGYDPFQPRYLAAPETKSEGQAEVAGGAVKLPVDRQVQSFDKKGLPIYTANVEYGDITANIVSAFELHFPIAHWWKDIDWVMKESYVPIQSLKDKYLNDAPEIKSYVKKKNGWDTSVLDSIATYNLSSLPIWWWERVSNMVEGPGPNIYYGAPETWEGYTIVRTFDRKPNYKWPKGRTIITVGDKVLYDSPKNVGGRAYDPRWPNRWHPYIRYRWEAQPGSVYGRALVTKLLPKIKRINNIDTTLIMWRRTVPIGSWIYPKGTNPVEGMFNGMPASHIEYDSRRTNGQEPKPVYPAPYPTIALQEREMMMAEMEMIAGTEQILHGERPVGVNSATMLDVLRKQALASRSAILQAWDESLENVGTSMLQEVIRNIKDDPRYAERIRILSREKASRLTIQNFSGTDLSDNVVVRVDTASEALVSKESKQQRALEVLQYAAGLAELPPTLQQAITADLGWPDGLTPKGVDITRAETLISFINSNNFEICVPFPEDDPYVMHEFLTEQLKSDTFLDRPQEQMNMIIQLMEHYRNQIEQAEKEQIQMQMDMMKAQAEAGAME